MKSLLKNPLFLVGLAAGAAWLLMRQNQQVVIQPKPGNPYAYRPPVLPGGDPNAIWFDWS